MWTNQRSTTRDHVVCGHFDSQKQEKSTDRRFESHSFLGSKRRHILPVARKKMLKFLCLMALAAFARADDVVVLGDDNFAEGISGGDLTLVKFYAPWCGHCKKLAPEYERAATELKSNDPPIPLAKVDCTAEGKDTCSKYDVKGFPTLKAFRNGEVAFEYQGPRDADGIIKYMKSKAGPSSRALASVADAEKFLSKDEHSVVGFFSSDSNDLYSLFQKAADALSEDFRFAHTTDKAVLDKYGYENKVVIFQPKRLQSKLEDSEKSFDGKEALYDLKNWINGNIHGLAGHRTTSNADQFRKPLVVVYYDVDYVKNAKGTNYWRNRVMKVAKKLQSEDKRISFSVSNLGDFGQEADEYGFPVEPSDKPVVAARDAKDRKYIMKDEFSVDNLEKFANDVLDGKLKPFIKSEPIPEDNDGPVKVVVGENFDEIVMDETKDVLIEFYAPWCGHCKSLAPKYEELGQKLSGESSVVIAKMDATANDVPSPYDVRGFPTIYYAPKNNKAKPKKYEGGREVSDFIKYLAAESTDGLEGYDKKGKKKKTDL